MCKPLFAFRNDSNRDNVYEITVIVSDRLDKVNQTLKVNLLPSNNYIILCPSLVKTKEIFGDKREGNCIFGVFS